MKRAIKTNHVIVLDIAAKEREIVTVERDQVVQFESDRAQVSDVV